MFKSKLFFTFFFAALFGLTGSLIDSYAGVTIHEISVGGSNNMVRAQIEWNEKDLSKITLSGGRLENPVSLNSSQINFDVRVTEDSPMSTIHQVIVNCYESVLKFSYLGLATGKAHEYRLVPDAIYEISPNNLDVHVNKYWIKGNLFYTEWLHRNTKSYLGYTIMDINTKNIVFVPADGR
jgi:aminopeptidase-like protein